VKAIFVVGNNYDGHKDFDPIDQLCPLQWRMCIRVIDTKIEPKLSSAIEGDKYLATPEIPSRS
jgi:hypothetical protein